VRIYARQPTAEEFRALNRLTRQAVGRVSPRAQLTLLSAQRDTVPELAPLVGRSRATVRLWSRRFKAHGPAGLSDAPRRGRPPQRGPRARETLLLLRPHEPRYEGSGATCWPVALRGVALRPTWGVRLSGRALRTAWHQVGRRWGRGWARNGACPRPARMARAPCAGRCIAARDAGGIGSARAGVTRLSWLSWSISWWRIPKAPSGASGSMSAATPPTR
jgi:transposase